LLNFFKQPSDLLGFKLLTSAALELAVPTRFLNTSRDSCRISIASHSKANKQIALGMMATIKYHMHYPIFMAWTGAAVISLTSYLYTVWTQVCCQAILLLGMRLGRNWLIREMRELER